MIRSNTGEGRQGSIWENGLPIGVDKTAVMPDECGHKAFVALGVGTINKWNFHKDKGVDQIIETPGFKSVECGGVFVTGEPS